MTYKNLNRALVIAAGLLLPTWALAEPPPPSKANVAVKGNATAQVQGIAGKGAPGAKDKPEGKPGHEMTGTKAKTLDPAARDAARAERRAAQHKEARDHLRPLLHGPMDDSMKHEMRRHAQRVARIERIKSLATDASDKDITDRATKLLDKENARHDKWMATYAAKAPSTAKAADPTRGADPAKAADPIKVEKTDNAEQKAGAQ